MEGNSEKALFFQGELVMLVALVRRCSVEISSLQYERGFVSFCLEVLWDFTEQLLRNQALKLSHFLGQTADL